MYFGHEVEATRDKSPSLQLIMPNNDHCSVPLFPNNRSKGQLRITFRRVPVDKYTKKGSISCPKYIRHIQYGRRVTRVNDNDILCN